eukprot:5976948-Pleurochrysis_carterae.AAC.1
MAAWICSSVAGFAGVSALLGASFIMTLAYGRVSVAVSAEPRSPSQAELRSPSWAEPRSPSSAHDRRQKGKKLRRRLRAQAPAR